MRFDDSRLSARLILVVNSLFLLCSALSVDDQHDPNDLLSNPAPAWKRQTETACVNGPESRGCWGDGFSVENDFDKTWPTTGRTRSYDWTVTNATCNPDGRSERYCSFINGQYPGPTLEADWGDTISVTIHNKLEYNGTSIHWHGVRQLNSNVMDGTNGLTECPISPGQSRTYTFQATQFGTSWYHSHHSAQYSDGVLGPIVFNGPASANYDIDAGPLLVSDWYYTASFAEEDIQSNILQNLTAGPPPDTLLINGTNGVTNGAYSITHFAPGKSHLLRLVNTAVEDPIRVSIDNHVFQVITADFVPITPVWTDSVLLGIGQRYDVVVQANQTIDNYWIRATPDCSILNPQFPAQAIIRYDGAPNSNPASQDTSTTTGCIEPGPLTPLVPNSVGSVDEFKAQARDLDVNIYLPGTATNNGNIVVWGINNVTMAIEWDNPTLQYVKTGNSSYPVAANLIELPTENIWVYWIIQEIQLPGNQPWHPMHLHGHDFYILGRGDGVFDPNTDPQTLQYNNPTRRDSANLPAMGWMVIAFQTDNPGAWLFHCHISWHISEGLGVQFLESKSSINIPDSFTDQCNDWQEYYNTALFKQMESGL